MDWHSEREREFLFIGANCAGFLFLFFTEKSGVIFKTSVVTVHLAAGRYFVAVFFIFRICYWNTKLFLDESRLRVHCIAIMSNNVDNDASKIQPRCKQNTVSVTKGVSLLRDPQLSKVCLFLFIDKYLCERCWSMFGNRLEQRSVRITSTSVLGHFGPKTELDVQFGPWSLRP